MVSTVLTEQEERIRRQKNIIVYNLPEFNQDVPHMDKNKKEFFKQLTAFNINTTTKLLKALESTS